uniref:LacI family DNA-binding transcriptional regulator n=1 Tax=Thaumasiovibrio occultus TaxID=1891184 RepID=UPI00192D12BC|nr:LacI family DNA-binding transcriptional regulator [Thaumasiovibrio occultus]
MRPKQKTGFATIADVAKLAKVGKTSVSRYLNGEQDKLSKDLRKRIAAAIDALNYRPSQSARMLKAGQSKMIGLLLADISNPYSIGVMQGIERMCKQAGYMLMVCNTDNQIEQQSRYLDLLRDYRVDGIIINMLGVADEQMDNFVDIDCPIVLVDRTSHHLNADSVALNNFDAIETGCKHLLSQNYESLLVVSQPLTIAPRIERLNAINDFVARNQGMRCEAFEIGASESSLTEAIEHFLRDNRGLKKAIISTNGVATMAAAKALKALNIHLGSQIGLLSVDDPDWVELVEGGISALRQPTNEIGHTACQLLINRIEGDNAAPVHVKMAAELIVRHSTAN